MRGEACIFLHAGPPWSTYLYLVRRRPAAWLDQQHSGSEVWTWYRFGPLLETTSTSVHPRSTSVTYLVGACDDNEQFVTSSSFEVTGRALQVYSGLVVDTSRSGRRSADHSAEGRHTTATWGMRSGQPPYHPAHQQPPPVYPYPPHVQHQHPYPQHPPQHPTHPYAAHQPQLPPPGGYQSHLQYYPPPPHPQALPAPPHQPGAAIAHHHHHHHHQYQYQAPGHHHGPVFNYAACSAAAPASGTDARLLPVPVSDVPRISTATPGAAVFEAAPPPAQPPPPAHAPPPSSLQLLPTPREEAQRAALEDDAEDVEMLAEWPVSTGAADGAADAPAPAEKAPEPESGTEAWLLDLEGLSAAARRVLAAVDALHLHRPGELIEATLAALPTLLPGADRAARSSRPQCAFAFVTPIGTPASLRAQEGVLHPATAPAAADGDALSHAPSSCLAVRVADGGGHLPLLPLETIAACRSLLRSAKPSVAINDAAFLRSQFGEIAPRRLGAPCGGLLLATVIDPPSEAPEAARVLGVFELLSSAPIGAGVAADLLGVARAMPALLARAHTRFGAAREAVMQSAASAPTPSCALHPASVAAASMDGAEAVNQVFQAGAEI